MPQTIGLLSIPVVLSSLRRKVDLIQIGSLWLQVAALLLKMTTKLSERGQFSVETICVRLWTCISY
jgi:hypothetical protein